MHKIYYYMMIPNPNADFQTHGNSKVFKECNLLENDYLPNIKTCFQASSFAPFCQVEKYLCSIWIQKQNGDSFFDNSLIPKFLRSFYYENTESMLYSKKTNDADFNDYLKKFCFLTSWQILKITLHLQLITEKKFEKDLKKELIRKNFNLFFEGTNFLYGKEESLNYDDYVLNESVFYVSEDMEEELLDKIMSNDQEIFLNILRIDYSFAFLCVLYGSLFQMKLNEIKIQFDNLRKEIKKYITEAGIIDFATAISKILDGNPNSFLFKRKNVFLPSLPLNFCALGILYFNFCLLNLKKNDAEHYYSINNLPKISFINFDGFDNVENWKILPMLRNCFQYVSINWEQSVKIIEENIKKAHHNIESYKNLVYIPIEYSKLNLAADEYIKSRHIYMIFEKIIFPTVRKFEPSLIVISHSFAFQMECHFMNKSEFNIKTWENVIYNLCKISNFKIIFVANAYERNEIDKIRTKMILNQNLKKSIESFTYSEENLRNNKFYIYQIMGSFIKVAQGKMPKKLIKKYYIQANELDLKVERNLIVNEHIKSIKNQNLSILNLKAKIIRLKQSKKSDTSKLFMERIEEFEDKMRYSSSHLINTINLLNLEKNSNEPKTIKTFNLIFEDKNFYYDEKARFYVLYDLKKVYFFNVRRAQQYFNFVFSFSKSDTDKLEGKIIQNYSNEYLLEDFSMCYENSKAIYLIWGRKTYFHSSNLKLRIDTTIHKLDCMNDKWEMYTPFTKDEVAAIPRMNTGSIFLPGNSNDKCGRIYIVGGYTNDPKYYQYDYYNIIDVVKLHLSKPEYTHKKIDKKNYQDYIPLKDSQLFPIFNPDGPDSFIIVGGADGSNFSKTQLKPFLSYAVEYNLERDQMNFMNDEKLFNNLNNINNLFFSSSNKNFWIKFDKQNKTTDIFFVNTLNNKAEKIVACNSIEKWNLPQKKSLGIIENRNEKYDLANGTYTVADFFFGEMKLGRQSSIKLKKDKSKVLNLTRELLKSMNFYNTSDKFCVGFTKNFLLDLHINPDKSAKINFHSVLLNSKPENYIYEIQARNFGDDTSVLVDQESQCFYFFYTIPEKADSEKNMEKLDFRNLRPKGMKKEIPKASKIANNLPIILKSSFIIGYDNQKKIIYSVGGVLNNKNDMKKCQVMGDNEGNEKIINYKIHIMKNGDINFEPMKNNLMEMNNPILAITPDFLMAIYPNIINNLNELNFYEPNMRNINVKSKCRNMRNIVYGEIFDRKNTKDWKFFMIDLDYDNFFYTNKEFEDVHTHDEEVSDYYFGKIYSYKGGNNDEVSFFVQKCESIKKKEECFKENTYCILSLRINSIGEKIFHAENETATQIEENKKSYFELYKTNLAEIGRVSDFIIFNNEIYDKSGKNIKIEIAKFAKENDKNKYLARR